jgi:DNA-binding beta-propeller fold protein YncE
MCFVAILLAVAVVAGLIYVRQAIGSRNQNGGPHHASPAKLIGPEGIAVTPDGTVYVSDYIGNRVFRMLAGGGFVSIAGGGVGGDGPATDANLFHPGALALDRYGNLYVSDQLGSAIRRIDRQGTISTVTRMISPWGLAFDSAGVLYVSTYDGLIEAIDTRGGMTSLDVSLVRNPAPSFGYMAFDSAGNLYASDYEPGPRGIDGKLMGGCRIIRLSPSQGHTQVERAWAITVLAGTGTCGFSGDGGPAKSAQLNEPSGIVFDAAGNLYFSDTGNHRIRRIDKNGIITTVAGTGVPGFSGDGGPAARAQLSYPSGMGITSGGLIYFSVASCNCMNPTTPGRVRVLRISDGTITSVPSG